MGIVDKLKELFGGGGRVADHAEEPLAPESRVRREEEDFEGVKDDDAVARGVGTTGAVLGPGTSTEAHTEFEADQDAPRNPGQ